MAVFRKIHTQFWSDPFVESLTPEKKYFFLYLLTNEKTRQCGIYEITTRQMSYDTGYNTETINALLTYFEAVGKICVSRETNEVAIKNWNKYNYSKSPDVKECIRKELTLVKNKALTEWLQNDNRVVSHSGQEEEEKEQEKEEEKVVGEIGSDKVREIANEVWMDEAWREQMCISFSIKMEELKRWLAAFNSSVSGDNILNFNKSSYKKMSRGWISRRKASGEVLPSGDAKISNAPALTILKPIKP